ncbi:MAG: HAMP domain-containing protein [Candidatus Omnitrophica bacterium]|nr:HAMP domain-containing protein [Candidatus Omnitrophota bacterium]
MLNKWFEEKLQVKFLVIVIATVAIFGLTAAMIVWGNEFGLLKESLHRKGHTLGAYIADISRESIISKDSIALDHIVKKINNDPEVLYTVIYGSRGNLLTDFFSSLNFKIPEIKGVLAALPDNTELADVITGIKKYVPFEEVTVPVMVDKETVGQVVIGMSEYEVREDIKKTIDIIILANAIAFFIAALLLLRLQSIIVFPIKEMADLTAEVSKKKDYSLRTDFRSHDELGLLAAGLNEMLEQIQKHENEIEAHRRYLELEVQERTRKLDSVSQELGLEKSVVERINQELSSERHMVVTMREDLKKADQGLKLVQAQLVQAEKMASLGQLAAGVAHEINNPMGYVLSNLHVLEGYIQDLDKILEIYTKLESLHAASPDSQEREILNSLEYLKKDCDLGYMLKDLHKIISETSSGAAKVAKIVTDLKSFARIGSEELMPADIHEVMDLSLNIVSNEMKYKVEIKKEYGQVPQVLCYPQLLSQVFMNLFINAGQAITTNGRLTLTTWQEGKFVAIRVADTGCGIPLEVQGRIFEPFFTTKEVGKGTGLGLSIAYGIIQKHQGEITVKSVPGEGAAFTVKIPVDGPRPA